jgi:3-oxoacyl-[acyl-carrier-protein] synthase-3
MRADPATRILGIGVCLPEQVRTNDYWPSGFSPRAEKLSRANILALERSTSGGALALRPEITAAMAALGEDPFNGARERRVLADNLEPSDLEAEAARRAMSAAGVRPDEIDLVMVASLVPDRLHPSNAPAVQAKCELVNATAWSVDVGCASFQPHLVTGSALIASGAYRRILCVYSSACSRVLDYSSGWSPSFGDGASAFVLGEGPRGHGLLGHWSRTDGSLREGVVYAPIRDGSAEPRWYQHEGLVRLVSLDAVGGKSAGVRSTEFCVEASKGALADAGLTIDDVDFFLCNQSVGWLVDACRRALGLPESKTMSSFPELANIGAAIIPIHLDRARRAGKIKDGDRILIYSPGAGLTRAAVVYRWLAG